MDLLRNLMSCHFHLLFVPEILIFRDRDVNNLNIKLKFLYIYVYLIYGDVHK